MLLSLQEHLETSTNELHSQYEKYSVAVLTGRRKTQPAFIGTGFCISYGRKYYFVTASHVADEIDDGIYLGKRNFRSFGSTGFRTQRESARFDIAALPIEQILMEEVGVSPVGLSQIDRHGTLTEGFHCVIGYPASKNKLGRSVRVGDKQISSYCYGINTHRIDVDYSEVVPFV